MAYETYGSVRGCCGHRHRSIATAVACIGRDHAGCVAQGGYSDRYVRRAGGEPLSSSEEQILADLEQEG